MYADEIRAARALLHIDQAALAQLAHVSVVTVRRVEAEETASQVSAATIESIRRALEAAGAEFIENGVRRRRRAREDAASRYEALRAISLRSAAALGGMGEAELYDENGLPV